MSNRALDYMNPTCPEGAKWYACEATSTVTSPFVGCCKTDPCGVSGCNQGNLAPVSFNASAYDIMGTELREPSCDTGSAFYTCINIPKNDTTFWGCCKSNVCEMTDKVCKTGDLTMATIGDKDQQASYRVDGTRSGGDGNGGHSHTGVIVGSAVGGGVAIVAIVAILVFCLFRKRRAKSRRGSTSSAPKHGFPAPEKTSYRNSTVSEALPLYSSPKPPPFAAFGGQHQYQQIAQTNEPVEMPTDYHGDSSQRYSELPAEVSQTQFKQQPVEMESPMMSPYTSPRPSPRVPQSPLSGERPRTADTTYRVSMGNVGSAR